MPQAEKPDPRWRAARWLCLPLAAVLTLAGVAMLPDVRSTGSVVLLHGLALAAAVGLRRPGWAAVMLASCAILAWGLQWMLVWDESRWRYLLIGPALAFVFGDLGGARWRALLARLRRVPRVRILSVIVVVTLATVVAWWVAHPLLRARAWQSLDFQNVARSTVLDRTPPSEERNACLLEFTDPRGAVKLPGLVEEVSSWPWFACARSEERASSASWALAAGSAHGLSLAQRPSRWMELEDLYFKSVLLDMTNRAVGERGFVRVPVNSYLGLRWGGEVYSAGAAVSEAQTLSYSWPDLLSVSRLGHLAARDRLTGAAGCEFCGAISGPAPGVTENDDGSLTWTREDGAEVRVPAPSWQPDPPAGWVPQPTMPRR